MSIVSIRNFFVMVLVLLSGCGGGGGGGEGGSGGVKRTTGTGIRILHGSLDETPLSIIINGVIIQSARFAEPTAYASIPAGEFTITVKRQNSDEIVAVLPMVAREGVEYSLLVWGSVRKQSVGMKVVEDQVVRAVSGSCFVRAYNSFESSRGIVATFSTSATDRLGRGDVSGFIELPAGLVPVAVKRDSGSSIFAGSVDCPNGGEVSMLVTGAEDPYVVFAPFLADLD